EKRGRLLVLRPSGPIFYRDVITKAWYAPYVASVIDQHIAEGYKDASGKLTGEFGVANPITYAEVLKMVLVAAGKDKGDAESPPRSYVSSKATSALTAGR